MSRTLPRRLTIAVFGICIALGLGLARVAAAVNTHSNHRLIAQQVQQAAAALTSATPAVQADLSSALQVAVDTSADRQVFQRFAASELATTKSLSAISLWQVGSGAPRQIASQGMPLALVSHQLDSTFLGAVRPSSNLYVTGMLAGSSPRIGYAEMPTGDTSGLVVYAESALPASRQVSVPASSPFADLRFALYLGPKATSSELLEETAPPPRSGWTTSTAVPFGDTVITLVGSSSDQLAGGLSAALPWIVLGVGVVLALASGSTVEYMARRRAFAESLANDNARLYREQRDIAVTLQHALLPQVPVVDGVEIAARYLAGVAGIEVGGDWYDVIRTGERRFVFFVGDVSGRGLRAATTMASLRYAVRAYVAQGDDIETVLAKLGDLLDVEVDHHFATVLAADVDLARGQVRLASAGHFMPLLLADGAAEFVIGNVEPPIGVASGLRPTTVSFGVAAGTTLVAFTDGVVERKGESIDVGLQRLRAAARATDQPLEHFLDDVMSALVPGGADDDVVMLGLRWHR
jgi:serine phosphatase RsbU (regulator of sigma subunit)